MQPPKNELMHLYFEKKLTQQQIADLYQVHKSTVQKWFQDYGLETIERWERLTIPTVLTDEQKSILIGSLLGDGCLPKTKGSNSYFVFSQDRKQAGYVRWLANKFKYWLTPKGVTFYTWRTSRIGNKVYVQHVVTFETIRHPVFTELRNWFYLDTGKKIVPFKIEESLTPLSIAVWFMDNGSQRKISTYNFTFFEVEILQSILKTKFDVDSEILKFKLNGKVFPELHILSHERFFHLIAPVVMKIPSMIYKIPKSYRTFGSPETIRLPLTNTVK